MTDSDIHMTGLLEANAEFYRAFRTGDLEAMVALWVADDDILCTHPGHATLQGRNDVLESWFDILSSPPPVQVRRAHGVIVGVTAIVTCEEEIGDAVVAATNIFRMQDGEWRLMHHHGGQIFATRDPDDDDADEEASLH